MSESIVKNVDFSYLNGNKKMINTIKNSNYQVDKSHNKFRLFTKDMAIDNLFNELETTKDNNGTIIDTRFNNEIQGFIRGFINEKGYEFIDTGYQSLRAACYNMNTKDRLELCRYINYKFDKKIDIDKTMKGTKFFDKFKDSSAAMLGGAAIGAGVGAAVNMVKPELGADLIRDPLKKTTEKIVQENALPLFQKPITEFANFILDNKVLNQALPVNLAVFTAGGLAVGAVGSCLSTVYGIFNNISKRIKNNKKYEEFIEIDNQIYAMDNKEEADKISRMMMDEENRKGK